jgi:hypothetical protein
MSTARRCATDGELAGNIDFVGGEPLTLVNAEYGTTFQNIDLLAYSWLCCLKVPIGGRYVKNNRDKCDLFNSILI